MRDARAMLDGQGDLVNAYWRYHAFFGGDREQRLAAGDLLWASSRVEEVMRAGTVAEAVELLELLLIAPTADAAYVGAGPLEELLTARPEAAAAVAHRCRVSVAASRWRDAVAGVWLSEHAHTQLPELVAYLDQPLPGT